MNLTMPFRLEPVLDEPRRGQAAIRLAVGACVALLVGAALLLASGYDPVVAYSALARGAFGSMNAISGTINKAVPIGLCAIGIAFAYRARLWNIGAEGQLYFGAFGAAGVGLFLPPSTPPVVALPLVLLAGMLGGGLWAFIAAALKAYRGVNEILTTLMLNYVAILWVAYLVTGPWSDPLAYSFPYSAPIIANAQPGRVFAGIHPGIIVLVAASLGLWWLDRSSRLGFNLRVAGDAPRAALYGGVNHRTVTLVALTGAGALAGLAGAIEIAGSTTRLQSGLSPGYGFIAILVAWLAQGRPLAIVFAALIYSGLLNGGFALQVSSIPPATGTILQAVLLLCFLAAATFGKYRIRRVPASQGSP
ncbi:ABC transporter permease [Bauldia litoralis]|uniref:Nucleoside ABC transporter membrane protein n=1 Tax=Bauldia litoralis TaxID=665467 RepID=A0A1G6DL77_9HYPH|nr:ABC transporter permease [Bauldia litoralis]SDB45886.1 nucleoside ABC transporter membrane protein [Bauldia litoralis]